MTLIARYLVSVPGLEAFVGQNHHSRNNRVELARIAGSGDVPAIFGSLPDARPFPFGEAVFPDH